MALSRKTTSPTWDTTSTAKYQDSTDPLVDIDASDVLDLGNHEIVTYRNVSEDAPRSNPVAYVKESGQELSHTKWMGPGQLIAQVLIIAAFLAVFMVAVWGIDALAGVTLIPFLSGQWF